MPPGATVAMQASPTGVCSHPGETGTVPRPGAADRGCERGTRAPDLAAADAYTRRVTAEPLSLRLLNDYEVVVAGLRAMLEPFGERVRVVEEDVRQVSERRVDVTLYDTFGRALADQRDLDELAADPATGTVVVYAWNTRETAGEPAGLDYVDKSLPAHELVAELERIAGRAPARGGAARGPAAPAPVETAARPAEPEGSWPGREHGLSVREAEVVALITQGRTNSEIAATLYLSLNSLKSYIRTAYRKMGVERRSQAVRWGIEHGMLPSRPGGR